MTYRNELDAAQNRADALEKQLSAAKQELALVKHKGDQALVPAGSTALDRASEPGTASRRWLGAPIMLKFERTVDGELPESAYGEIVDTIHQRLEHTGAFTMIKGSFSWNSTGHTKNSLASTNVYISSRRGKTTLRVEQNIGGLAGALYGGVGGGVGGGAIMAPLAPVFFAPWMLAVTIPVWLGGWAWACRRWYKRSASKRATKLENLAYELAEVARVCIQEAASEAADQS